jgi:hypothetical protein
MIAISEFLSKGAEELLGRLSGPLNFRLLVMPLVVSVLAIRAHLKDVREGRPVFMGAFLADPSERRRLLRSGLKDFGKVFIMACLLDTIYQIIALKTFHPGQMLIVAVVCAIVPYFLVRGPVMRIAHVLHRKRAGSANQAPDARKR